MVDFEQNVYKAFQQTSKPCLSSKKCNPIDSLFKNLS